jgi:hypothetical protein
MARSRGLGDVYKRQVFGWVLGFAGIVPNSEAIHKLASEDGAFGAANPEGMVWGGD